MKRSDEQNRAVRRFFPGHHSAFMAQQGAPGRGKYESRDSISAFMAQQSAPGSGKSETKKPPFKRKAGSWVLILLAVFLIFMLGNLAYRLSQRAIEQNYVSSYRAALQNSSRVLDMNLKSIIDAVRRFLNEEDLQNVLMNAGNYPAGSFSTEDKKALEAVARTLAWQQALVNDVVFMDLYGHHYMLSNTRGSYEFDLYYDEHDFLLESWSEKARQANGKEVFFGQNVLGVDLGRQVLSMAKYMIDPSTGEGIGYVVVTLSRALLARSYVGQQDAYKSSGFLVTDEEKNAIYYSGREEETESVLKTFNGRTSLSDPSSDKYVIADVINQTTGWTLLHKVDRSELSRDSNPVRAAVWLGGSGALLLVVIFVRLLLSNQRLAEHLMATRLNEREAELLLLQSQINPHFLYNTLDSVYFLAIVHGDEQIADLVMALSDHFKLTLNSGRRSITIRDSLLWIRGYMKIQNVRYHDRFDLIEEVDESLLDHEILTFLLQPFVENAMYHGLEAKIGKGSIKIVIKKEQQDMIMEIIDDGAGMEDLSVWENGYAVKNVRERIRLNYGDPYTVTAESRPGEGTRVTIRLPLDTADFDPAAPGYC